MIIPCKILQWWVDGVRSLGQSPKQFFCQPSLLPSSVYFNWNLCCTFIINIDFVNLYICTMYLFHINSIKYVYSTFHSISQQMIFRGILFCSILKYSGYMADLDYSRHSKHFKRKWNFLSLIRLLNFSLNLFVFFTFICFSTETFPDNTFIWKLSSLCLSSRNS